MAISAPVAEEATAPPEADQQVTDEVQAGTRILRLLDAQIDRFLTEVSDGEHERLVGTGSGTDAVDQMEEGVRAKALVKRVSKQLKPLGTAMWALESALKERKVALGNKEAKVGRLEREVSELKDTDLQSREITDLRAENKQLQEDKEAMVRTVNQLMHSGHLNTTVTELKTGVQEHEEHLRSQYQRRVESLEADVAKARAKRKELEQQLDAEKQRNADGKARLDSENATSVELRKDAESLHRTLEQVQEENQGLIDDKSQLMGTLRDLLAQNTKLRKQTAAAKRALDNLPKPAPAHEEPKRTSLLRSTSAVQADRVSEEAVWKLAVGTSPAASRMIADASEVLDLADDDSSAA